MGRPGIASMARTWDGGCMDSRRRWRSPSGLRAGGGDGADRAAPPIGASEKEGIRGAVASG